MILGLDAYNFWSWLERWFAKGKMFNFLSFLGLHERVEMVTKDLTHPNIFYKPLIRVAWAWILRSFSVVKALQRPEQNYQNSGFFRRTWRGCSGDQGPRARANFEQAVLQIYPGVVYTK